MSCVRGLGKSGSVAQASICYDYIVILIGLVLRKKHSTLPTPTSTVATPLTPPDATLHLIHCTALQYNLWRRYEI